MTKISKTEAEWQQQLSPEAYVVTRQHGTERPFTSPMNSEKRDGMFTCAGCGKEIFRLPRNLILAPAGPVSQHLHQLRRSAFQRQKVNDASHRSSLPRLQRPSWSRI